MNSPLSVSATLRETLTQRLLSEGDLKTGEWAAAMNAIPREAFVREYFRQVDEPGKASVYIAEHPDGMDAGEWLARIYENETLITQLDRKYWPSSPDAPSEGVPTSSSTLPGLVI